MPPSATTSTADTEGNSGVDARQRESQNRYVVPAVCGSQHLTIGGSLGWLARSTTCAPLSSFLRPPSDVHAIVSHIIDNAKLHPFFSAGLSCQVGKLSRPLLSYASFSVRYDDGPSHDSDARRQTLSTSMSTQLIGPSRLRLHATLEAVNAGEVKKTLPDRPVLFRGGAGSCGGLHVLPLVVHDVGVGIDVLPRAAGGIVRLLTWVAPFRREAMVEVRLWEQ